MTVTVDRPLTDAQEHALVRLGDAWDRWVNGGPKAPSPWLRKPCRSVSTLTVLEHLGLVELRPWRSTLDYEAQITEAGRAMLRSMGD